MGFLNSSFGTFNLMRNLWTSGFDPNGLVHNFLNYLVPRISISALISFLPPYLAFKFVDYIRISIFSENLTGKVVLITGASSGIGEHVAYEYARRGSCLVLAARRVNSLREVAEIASFLGSPYVILVGADISKVEDCKRLIEITVEHFGQLDHLVNCAGITPLGLFEELNDVDNFAPSMVINQHINSGKQAAVVSFFETLRVELRSEVGITILMPGLIESEMTKGKFLMPDGETKVDQEMRDVEGSIIPIRSVEKCAKAIVNGASRGDRYLTEPSWMRAIFFYKVFSPEVLELLNRWLLLPSSGRPATQAPSKILLNLSGLKNILYTPSVLSPEIKTD
ncbi:hypothetical protein ACH5RR_025284 [Cinchona calisaya]|uniref:Uncharacterized protein n=1 Tax=Cinchona calisaya TaxID=153742 RepID=A0ABD2Z386_9GENT